LFIKYLFYWQTTWENNNFKCNKWYIIRPPEESGKALFSKELRNQGKSFVYYNGPHSGLCHTSSTKQCIIHFAHLSLNFKGGGVKSSKTGLDFGPQSSLSRPHFETQQHICNIRQSQGASMISVIMCVYLIQFDQVTPKFRSQKNMRENLPNLNNRVINTG